MDNNTNTISWTRRLGETMDNEVNGEYFRIGIFYYFKLSLECPPLTDEVHDIFET